VKPELPWFASCLLALLCVFALSIGIDQWQQPSRISYRGAHGGPTIVPPTVGRGRIVTGPDSRPMRLTPLSCEWVSARASLTWTAVTDADGRLAPNGLLDALDELSSENVLIRPDDDGGYAVPVYARIPVADLSRADLGPLLLREMSVSAHGAASSPGRFELDVRRSNADRVVRRRSWPYVVRIGRHGDYVVFAPEDEQLVQLSIVPASEWFDAASATLMRMETLPASVATVDIYVKGLDAGADCCFVVAMADGPTHLTDIARTQAARLDRHGRTTMRLEGRRRWKLVLESVASTKHLDIADRTFGNGEFASVQFDVAEGAARYVASNSFWPYGPGQAVVFHKECDVCPAVGVTATVDGATRLPIFGVPTGTVCDEAGNVIRVPIDGAEAHPVAPWRPTVRIAGGASHGPNAMYSVYIRPGSPYPDVLRWIDLDRVWDLRSARMAALAPKRVDFDRQNGAEVVTVPRLGRVSASIDLVRVAGESVSRLELNRILFAQDTADPDILFDLSR
jgi:hypothetical protein